MSKIFVCSDLHLSHDRQFVWGVRGFNSVEEMNIAIIERFNSVVGPEDEVYILGDLCLGGADSLEANRVMLEQLNGKLHIIIGNHDTPARIAMYQELPNVVEVVYATMLRYRGYHFYLSHFPTLTANLEKETLKQCTINISGHTHSKDPFYQDMPFMYNCAMDAHNCFPVLLDDAIEHMKLKVKECKEQM